MHKWVLLLSLIVSLLLPFSVFAQGEATFSTLLIQIWPEYDEPEVLVIYSISLPDTTNLPATISIRIPTRAGEPNAVAVRQVDGTLFNMDYTRQVSGDWATITFSTTAPQVQLEYYDPGLEKESSSRHFEYVWPGDHAVTELTLQVQQPVAATNMVISPSLGSGSIGNDGLTYYTQNIGAISAGQNIRLTLDYQKATDALSVESQSIGPSAPIDQVGSQDQLVSTWLPWILGLLGAGLIIGGIIWFWQTGRQRPLAHARTKRSRSVASKRDSSPTSTEEAVYCSQCGKRAAAGDVFCRFCGTKISGK